MLFFTKNKKILITLLLCNSITTSYAEESTSSSVKTFFYGSVTGAALIGIAIATKGKVKLPTPITLPWNRNHRKVMDQLTTSQQTIQAIKTECSTLTTTTGNHTKLLNKLQESVDLLKKDSEKLLSRTEAMEAQQNFIANQVVYIRNCVSLLAEGFIAKTEHQSHRIPELIEKFKQLTWVDKLFKNHNTARSKLSP